MDATPDLARRRKPPAAGQVPHGVCRVLENGGMGGDEGVPRLGPRDLQPGSI